jgi:hypothetical protein
VNAPHEAAGSLASERLFQMQIRIARRADEISKSEGSSVGGNLIAWLQAEREVLAQAQGFHAAADAFLARSALD